MRQAFKPITSTYVPVDEIAAQPRTRILRRLQHFDWITSEDLFIALDVAESSREDDAEHVRYAQALRRLVKEGLVLKRGRVDSRNRSEYRLAADVDLTIPPPHLDDYISPSGLVTTLDARLRSSSKHEANRRRQKRI